MRNGTVMKRSMAFVFLSVLLASPAIAADRSLAITIDGRPVSRNGTVAVLRRNVAYADLIELVRSYGGVVSISPAGASVTVRSRNATFVSGSASVSVDKTLDSMPERAFTANGTLFVPLQYFVTRIVGGTVRIDARAATARIALAPDALPQSTASPAPSAAESP